MALNGVLSNLRSLGAKLLHFVTASEETNGFEADLKKLMDLLERIKATLYDAEEREIRDSSVKLWLKELKEVAYDAEDVLDEYHYEVLRAQVEARDAAQPNSRKRKQIQMPDGMSDQIKRMKDRFDEICRARMALQLSEEDGPRRFNSELQIAQTSPFVVESDIIGRRREKAELIDLLSSECHDSNVVSVVRIVGTGGVGKTTLAQLVYDDQKKKQKFDKFGWVCVSEDFNVERLMRELVESFTRGECHLTNPDALRQKVSEEIRGKRVLLVLDDVWNEKRSLWESFQTSFRSAALVKILVTTRNEPVVGITQTVFNLGYLSKEQCWQLFRHYAFGEPNQNEGSELEEIGKQIVKKCGMLPLVVKSIACLLRIEAEEESWREILESELWESDARNEIFPSLQISYARLPTYLKPCFLYCSMFPKDYRYMVQELVVLWIYEGFIESDGKKSTEEIGWDYVRQLWQRSLFVGTYDKKEIQSAVFKMHDMVHDLARFNSENEFYSIVAGKVPDFPKKLYRLYVDRDVKLVEPLPSGKFTALRTLIVSDGVENASSTFNFSKAQKLRVLGLWMGVCEEVIFSVVNLKHLRYLSLRKLPMERLPECMCSLYSLQNLSLEYCHDLRELPESIGNLVSLQELVLDSCTELRVLPLSLCQLKVLIKLVILRCYKLKELPNDIGNLTNLQILKIASPNSISSLPPSLSRLTRTKTLKVGVRCETIGWLKDFVDLKGTLCLEGLKFYALGDVQCASLVSLHNLESLKLSYNAEEPYSQYLTGWFEKKISLNIDSSRITSSDEQNDFTLMDRLQPHHNLRKLCIDSFRGTTFPNWIGNPTSCASLEKIDIAFCKNLTILPFGSLRKLKHLVIAWCRSLRSLQADSLPSELQQLQIYDCYELISVPGIQKLNSLVTLCIRSCISLRWLVTDAIPSGELTMRTNQSSCQNSLLGLRNLTSLRNLDIIDCQRLQLLEDELLPTGTCKVEVWDCPRLKEWCLQHSFTYREVMYPNLDDDDDNDDNDA